MSSDQPGDRLEQADGNAPLVAAHHVRLPGFVVGHEIGLGDVIKRSTTAVGVKPCGSCEERARRLNRWMVFTPKGRG